MKRAFYNPFEGKSLTDMQIEWPQEGQRIFGNPGFRANESDIAHVDWLAKWPGEMTHSSGYKEAADLLVEALRHGGDGTHPDRFVFPIAYLYRHAAELKMKELIELALTLQLLENDSQLRSALKRHNLLQLWTPLKGAMIRYWPDGNQMELLAASDLVAQLDRVDSDGQQLRYSKTTTNKPILVDLPDLVDMSNMRFVFAGLWNMLDGTHSAFVDALDCLQYEAY